MIRRFSTLLAAAGVALLATFAALSVLPATAQPGDPPDSGDPRAVAHPGNATTCAAAGLDGGKVSVQFTLLNNRFLTITSVPADVELTGTVLNARAAYNVYTPSARIALHAPLNETGNIPGISSWFACGIELPPTTTTTTTTTETTTTDTTTTETTTTDTSTVTTTTETTTSDTTTSEPTTSDTTSGTTSSVTTTPSPTTTSAGGGGAGGGNGDLPRTGVASRGPLVAGTALLLLGAGLAIGVQRSRRRV